ncbi:MAG: MCE family protein [Pseudodesulfovibrio sp.]|nr:MCE family protein [Pseudodesulfovibrio sp.]
MIRKHDYFKLGLFIILGTCMLMAVIIILGAGRYFETTYQVETYFDESINGLAIGSPVKLRGVNIGRVSAIDFISNKYDEANKSDSRYVYVECEINPELFKNMTLDSFNAGITREIARGLRVRPTSLGLTGQLFLNFVYTDLESSPNLKINWTPENVYIPSVPSTMSRVETAITTISNTLNGLKQEDIAGIIKDIRSIVSSIDGFMKTKGGQEAGNRILGVLEEARLVLHRTNQILADPATEQLIPQTAQTITGINRIINNSEDNIIAAAREAKNAMASFKQASDILAKTLADPRMDKAMSDIAPTLENISKASSDMTAAVAKVHALVNRLNSITASEEANIHTILEDTREVMQNIKELSGDAKRYPSGVFFGNPPSKPSPNTQ